MRTERALPLGLRPRARRAGLGAPHLAAGAGAASRPWPLAATSPARLGTRRPELFSRGGPAPHAGYGRTCLVGALASERKVVRVEPGHRLGTLIGGAVPSPPPCCLLLSLRVVGSSVFAASDSRTRPGTLRKVALDRHSHLSRILVWDK